MKLVSCNLEDVMVLPERKYSDIYSILTDFLNSSDVCVKIEDYPHRNVSSCVCSIRQTVKGFYKGQIKVIQRKGDIYLVKSNAIK